MLALTERRPSPQQCAKFLNTPVSRPGRRASPRRALRCARQERIFECAPTATSIGTGAAPADTRSRAFELAIHRSPAVRHRSAPVLRPSPIGTAIPRLAEIANFRLVRSVGVEIHPCGQGARQQKRAIDRRQFALPGATTGLHVEEMIVEPVVARRIRSRSLRAVPEEAQRGKGSFHRAAPRHVTALDRDRIAGQGETGRSDAGGPVCRILVDDKAIGRIGFVQEISEGIALSFSNSVSAVNFVGSSCAGLRRSWPIHRRPRDAALHLAGTDSIIC